jgi:hypothetical protein
MPTDLHTGGPPDNMYFPHVAPRPLAYFQPTAVMSPADGCHAAACTARGTLTRRRCPRFGATGDPMAPPACLHLLYPCISSGAYRCHLLRPLLPSGCPRAEWSASVVRCARPRGGDLVRMRLRACLPLAHLPRTPPATLRPFSGRKPTSPLTVTPSFPSLAATHVATRRLTAARANPKAPGDFGRRKAAVCYPWGGDQARTTN